jgi:hypothetical protein
MRTSLSIIPADSPDRDIYLVLEEFRSGSAGARRTEARSVMSAKGQS